MGDSKKVRQARARAREARAELAARKKKQADLVEHHQIVYFAAQAEIAAVDEKIEALRQKVREAEAERDSLTANAQQAQQRAMGALVVEAEQSIDDVAVLLGVSVAAVRKAKSAYTKHAASSSADADEAATEAPSPSGEPEDDGDVTDVSAA